MSFTVQEKKNGFMPITDTKDIGLDYYPVATTVNIAKGDVVGDNGSGYAALETALDGATLGIAAADANNAAGADGAIDVPVIPIEAPVVYVVANESGTGIAQTDVGETVDLESEDGIDVTDVTVTANGFKIIDLDATNDYAKGRFVAVT